MPKEQIVTGIDIGSTKVVTCVGAPKEGIIDIIGVSNQPNSGVRKGVITDIEETISAITASLEEAERMAGIPIESALLSISGTQISCTHSKGIIAISRSDGEISEIDVERVIEAAKTVAIPPNQEIIHIIPQYFTIDEQEEQIKDPIGMSGVRLEVNTQVINSSTSSIRNLTKCISQAGIEIEELVFTPLATADILLSKKQKEAGVVLLDIGAMTTEMIVFEEGNMIHAKVLPIGSSYITNDIAIGLRTTMEAAEKIKVRHANANIKKIKDSEQIQLSSFDPTANNKVSRKYLAEIVEARLIEIFSMVKDELKNIKKDGLLPAGVVFTGGGSNISGLTEFSKEYLRLPAQLGNPIVEVSGMVDKLDDPVYTASVGLMLRGIHHKTHRHQESSSSGKSMDKFVDKAKDIFKHFIP
jgi:cell division protein FtsA